MIARAPSTGRKDITTKTRRTQERSDVSLCPSCLCGEFKLTTIILGQAYPRSRFVGFDNHAPSVERAGRLAAATGFSRVRRAAETPFNRVFELRP